MKRPTAISHRNILVVDNDEAIRRLLERLLSERGYTVRPAEDGEHAIDVFRQSDEQYAAVIMDIELPGLDGPQTLRVLREIGMEAPVIFTSSDFIDYPTDSLHAIGGDGILAKPFSFLALDEMLRSQSLAPIALS